eukprot:3357239-Pleurochrysis_carterae.AAC.1
MRRQAQLSTSPEARPIENVSVRSWPAGWLVAMGLAPRKQGFEAMANRMYEPTRDGSGNEEHVTC